MRLKEKTFISTVNQSKTTEIRSIFEHLGAVVFDFPMIEIVPAEITDNQKETFNNLEKFDWIIFTSSNGIKYFYHFIEKFNISQTKFADCKIAVLGKGTLKALENNQRTANFVGSRNTADDLANELIHNNLIQNKKILLALGNLASDRTEKKLFEFANVQRIDVYKTIKPKEKNSEVINLVISDKYDLILVTSPSAIDNFVETIGRSNLPDNLRIASIGKVTAQAVEKHGFKNEIIAKTSTYLGLAEEITKYYNNL